MNLAYIIKETLLMMGFTFVVGVAFAYLLKAMTLIFSLSANPGVIAIWRRAYKMDLSRIYRAIFHANDGMMSYFSRVTDQKKEMVLAMDQLAEYHFGELPDDEAKDTEMNNLYEYNHGKI